MSTTPPHGLRARTAGGASGVYANRAEAGRALATVLHKRLSRRTPVLPIVVYALPRGGVPVAAEVARALHAPLDLLIVRKIGAPGQPELAVGAVAEGVQPELVLDEESMAWTGTDAKWVQEQSRVAYAEVLRRHQAYLAGRASPEVKGAVAIIVDDGAATGTTVRAAVQALRHREPARIVLALPVAPAEVVEQLRKQVDEVVCLAEPVPFRAVGLHYGDFHQVDDEEVVRALREAEAASPPVPAAPA